MTAVRDIIPDVLLFTFNPTVIGTYLYYLIRRHKFLQFFQDWKQMEHQAVLNRFLADDRDNKKIKIFCLGFIMFFVSLLIFLVTIFSFFFEDINENNSIIRHGGLILEHYNYTAAGIPLKYFLFFRFAYIIVMLVFYLISDVTPACVYLHAAIHIQTLKPEIGKIVSRKLFIIGNQSSNEVSLQVELGTSAKLVSGPLRELSIDNKLKQAFSHYDNVSSLVNRADSLFGPLFILNQGLLFFVICALSYSLIYSLKGIQNGIDLIICSILLIFYLFRIIGSVTLMSTVQTSVNQLRSTLATAQFGANEFLTKTERQIIKYFLNRLDHDQLAASPLGLYKINPPILLSMLSLVVSYTIVLLQS